MLVLWKIISDIPQVLGHFLAVANLENVLASTPLSDQISKDLKKLGFRFVGTLITYAFLQGVGLVNDHVG